MSSSVAAMSSDDHRAGASRRRSTDTSQMVALTAAGLRSDVLDSVAVPAPYGVRHSEAADLRTCEMMWQTVWQHGRPSPPTIEMVRGTYVHLVLEHVYQLAPAERTYGAALEIARRLWSEWSSSDPEWCALDVSAAASLSARRFIARSLHRALTLERPEMVRVVSTEWSYDTWLRLSGRAPGGLVGESGTWIRASGTVDRVDLLGVDAATGRAQCGVVDYKTGSPPPESYRGRVGLQVWLYAAAVQQLYDVDVVSARLVYCGDRSPQIIDLSDGLLPGESEQQIAAALDAHYRASRRIGELRSGAATDVQLSPSPLCGWCPLGVSSECAAGAEMVARRRR